MSQVRPLPQIGSLDDIDEPSGSIAPSSRDGTPSMFPDAGRSVPSNLPGIVVMDGQRDANRVWLSHRSAPNAEVELEVQSSPLGHRLFRLPKRLPAGVYRVRAEGARGASFSLPLQLSDPLQLPERPVVLELRSELIWTRVSTPLWGGPFLSPNHRRGRARLALPASLAPWAPYLQGRTSSPQAFLWMDGTDLMVGAYEATSSERPHHAYAGELMLLDGTVLADVRLHYEVPTEKRELDETILSAGRRSAPPLMQRVSGWLRKQKP